MIEFLAVFGSVTITGLLTILVMLQFAVGEPSGQHSRFNPDAVPASKFGAGAHREPLWPVKVRA